jgi:hypothetical protein
MGFVAAAVLMLFGLLLFSRKSVLAKRDGPTRPLTVRSVVYVLSMGIFLGCTAAIVRGTIYGWTRDVWEYAGLFGGIWVVGEVFQALHTARVRSRSK